MTGLDFASLAVEEPSKVWDLTVAARGLYLWGWARAALEPGAKMNWGSCCVPGLCRFPTAVRRASQPSPLYSSENRGWGRGSDSPKICQTSELEALFQPLPLGEQEPHEFVWL